MPSVVIPAHNEATVIGRLLAGLLAEAQPGEFDVIVVPNGCTDDTAGVAEQFGRAVTVVSTDIPSKYQALRLGDRYATSFPRLYVDADVALSTADVRRLFAALQRPGQLAAAPERVLGTTGASRLVRWYYDVWQRLPTVRAGLYGRGVIGVSEAGYARLVEVPEVMGDDLAASVAFNREEAMVVPNAKVVVEVPRTAGDLLRRRVRAATVIAQLHEHRPTAVDASRTTKADLLHILRDKPWYAPRMAVFLGMTVLARRRAKAAIKAGDFTTWLRDESSRAAPAGEL